MEVTAMSSPDSQTSWRRESDDRGIRTLWFDQPARSFNLLDRPAIDELESHLADLEANPAVPGCIIRSGKPGGFCAGLDLHLVAGCDNQGEVEHLIRRGLTVINRLASLTIPTVAVIHGACLGGGLELALACRRRVALASAAPLQAGLPEIHLGLVPAWGGITRLPRIIRRREALDLLVTGRSIGYLGARSLGLVSRLASEADPAEALDPGPAAPAAAREDHEEPWDDVIERARDRLADQPGAHPEVQERILSLVAIDADRGPAAAQEAAVKAFAELALSAETREAIAWFFQRKLTPAVVEE
jgi:3-hydroxyacyl-CoA dehydrogenase/enoyl-CoA hydratase/3-hydroxybutyryl-CoA epimerase